MKTLTATLSRAGALASLCAACLPLTACMSSSPIWDAHMGEAVHKVMQAQIVHPSPPADAGPMSTDGKAAVSALNSYDKALRSPAPSSNPYVIGVSQGGASLAPGNGPGTNQ
jgi:hypothetical protein